jgi:hypothetical protein
VVRPAKASAVLRHALELADLDPHEAISVKGEFPSSPPLKAWRL